MNHKLIEVVCFELESALIAQQAGADRVELCANFSEGGVTPSFGTIKITVQQLKIPISVMIRPRGGDFLYTNLEFEIMKKDIEYCKTLGVDGVVFGILTADGKVDIQRNKTLSALAKPLKCTFHKAFDRVENPFDALDNIIDCGFDRILTSGLEKTAIDGVDCISKLITQANGRITIMPGGGVRQENILELIEKTKAKEYHTSANDFVASKMNYFNPKLFTQNNNSQFAENKTLSFSKEFFVNFVSSINKKTSP